MKITEPFVIAIAGQWEVGKSSVANFLKEVLSDNFDHHVEVIEVGDSLKLWLAQMTGGNLSTINESKLNPLFRSVLEKLSDILGHDFVLSAALDRVSHCLDKENTKFVIVTGLRRPTEAIAIKKLYKNSVVIRVRGKVSKPLETSEVDLEKICADYTICNDNTLEILKWYVMDLFISTLFPNKLTPLLVKEP